MGNGRHGVLPFHKKPPGIQLWNKLVFIELPIMVGSSESSYLLHLAPVLMRAAPKSHGETWQVFPGTKTA